MQHSLINPNQVQFHGLDFFDNPVRDNELCIKVDDKTLIPLKSKGPNCVFESRVPTRRELESCTNYDMKNDTEWNPQAVDLRLICNIYQVKKKSGQYIMSNAIQCIHFHITFPTTRMMCLHIHTHRHMNPF